MGQGTASGAMNLRSTHGPSSCLSPLRPRVEATELCERAPGTDRPDRPAKVLPEPNEELIDEEPVFLRDRRHKPLLGRLGGLRPHEPEAVAHPVHVGIRRNSRLAETVDKDAVRRLRADLRKLDELLVGRGNDSSVSLEEESTHLLNLARLLAVEADWLDQTLQVPHDEWDSLTDGRQGGQGPPPPCKSIP